MTDRALTTTDHDFTYFVGLAKDIIERRTNSETSVEDWLAAALIASEKRREELEAALREIANSQELRWITYATGLNQYQASNRRLSGGECAQRAREVLER